MDAKPIRFIGETVEAQFDEAPLLEKKPGCPDAFIWGDTTYRIVEMLSEWHDYRRRGKMERNMRPENLAAAASRGSWGVGRDYFRVRVEGGQLFDIYYDRAPKGSAKRKGAWFLYRELGEQ